MKPKHKHHHLLAALGFFLTAALSLSSCAPQANAPQSNYKMEILEQRVVALEEQELKTLSDLRGEVADFKKEVNERLDNFRKSQQFFIDELNTLKEDQQLVTNDIELAQRNIRRNKSRIDKLNKRLGDQVIALEELRTFFETNVNLAVEAEDEDKEEEDFDLAFKLFKARSFKKAEQAFIDFRKEHPDSKLVDDSIYFVAYMAFLQGDYSKSSLKFFELLKQYPDSNKKNDAKWWLGVSLERSGDLSGALDLYRELTELESTNPLRIKAEFRLEELAPSESE